MTRTKKLSCASIIGSLAQAIPTAWIVVNGTVPPWARWTLGVWLGLWALLMIVKGTEATS